MSDTLRGTRSFPLGDRSSVSLVEHCFVHRAKETALVETTYGQSVANL